MTKKQKAKLKFILNADSNVVHKSEPGERCNTDDMLQVNRKRVPAILGSYRKCKRCFGAGKKSK